MGQGEELAHVVVCKLDDRPVASRSIRCGIRGSNHQYIDHEPVAIYDPRRTAIGLVDVDNDSRCGNPCTCVNVNVDDHDDRLINRCFTGVSRGVVFTRGGDGHVHQRQDLRLLEDQSERHAIFRWSCQVATGLGRNRRFPALALRPYVEEDQEAQGAPAPLEGEPRQAPEHGARLVTPSSPRQ